MKGVIDNIGSLLIQRANLEPNHVIPQRCCFDKTCDCGILCAQFGEPHTDDDGVTYIIICQDRVLEFEELVRHPYL